MTSAHLLTREDIARWKTLPSHRHSFFQKYAWNQLLSDVYSYADFTLAAEDRRGNYAFLPLKLVKSRLLGNRLISVPFSDYAGTTDSELEAQEGLLRAASMLFRRLKIDFMELRLAHSHSEALDPYLTSLGFQKLREYKSFSIDLQKGEEKAWRKISPSTRRTITKSERGGVQVREAKNDADLQSYYLLYTMSAREHGSPAHPLRFLMELQSRTAAEGQMKLLIASSREEDVAGLLLFQHGGQVHYWQSALPSINRRLNPFHTLLWRALTDSIAHGYLRFDLGRTRVKTGIYRFKQTWGGHEYGLDHYCLFEKKPPTLADPEDLRYRTASNLWRRVPTLIQARLDPRFIREIAL